MNAKLLADSQWPHPFLLARGSGDIQCRVAVASGSAAATLEGAGALRLRALLGEGEAPAVALQPVELGGCVSWEEGQPL